MLVCHICLVRGTNLYDMDTCKLKTCYETLTNSLLPDDGLPRSLCWECRARLQSCARFRAKALRSQALLSTLALFDEQNLDQTLEAIDRRKLNIASSLVTKHLELEHSCCRYIDDNTTQTNQWVAADNSSESPGDTWKVQVKEERDRESASETATRLYDAHDVKEDLVIGPDKLQPQDMALDRACVWIKKEAEINIKSEEDGKRMSIDGNELDDSFTMTVGNITEQSDQDSSDLEIFDNSYDTADANAISKSLPPKSKDKYEKTYEDFVKWKTGKSASFSESVLLAYFKELSRRKQPSTLWCEYSKLKTTIRLKHNIYIGEYAHLSAFLKRNTQGFVPRKSKVLSGHDIERFLKEAPDEIYLLEKVVLIFGVNGACRSNELPTITTEDVRTHDSKMSVRVRCTKTDKERIFTVQDEQLEIVQKYQSLRPQMKSDRFFLNFKSGKCTKQVVGRHKMAGIPKRIATYLGLPDAETSYTGHCLRSTAKGMLSG